MFRQVTLPLWLLVLILLFAAVAALTHFLLPSVRWFLRRRMQRVVTRLNQRLERPIEPFKLMRRPDMIVRLVHDPKVMEAVVAEAAETGDPETVVFQRARAYAREIVPSFSATIYFGIATRLAKWLVQLIYRVRISYADEPAFRAISAKATVVFVMNHRSNMDYVLVTHLVADRSALSYAVGEWARIWPLSGLIRSMGAYFIRRRFNSPLYRRVLARYVQMAIGEGVTQAIFPEGGLSLTGGVGAARLGILSYMVAGHPAGGRDVVFVPVALNYDRVLEDRVLIGAAAKGERRFRASVGTIGAFFLRHLWRKLRGRFRPFGFAAVSFGRPLSLDDFLSHPHAAPTEALAEALMDSVRHNQPILPVPLAAAVLAGAQDHDADAATLRADALARRLRAANARLVLPLDSAATGFATGIDNLVMRGIVRRDGKHLQVTRGNDALIAFYAASVWQVLDAAAA